MNPKLSLSSARCTHSRATEPLPTCAQPLRKCDPPSPGITGGSTLAGAKGTCISNVRRGSLQPARRVASVGSAPAQALQFSLEVGSSAFPAAHSPPGPTHNHNHNRNHMASSPCKLEVSRLHLLFHASLCLAEMIAPWVCFDLSTWSLTVSTVQIHGPTSGTVSASVNVQNCSFLIFKLVLIHQS